MDNPLLEGFAIVVLTAVYFAVGCTNALELVDEGQLVYASWRVSEGAVPFREFMHLYGPSAFLLNGVLLRIFGADLLVIRLSLVLLKSLTALIVYRSARCLAPRTFAALVTVFFVALAGTPWVYTSPYPNHYALTLVLAGLWTFLAVPRFAGACLLAGAFFGAAATFKQTTGIFAAVSFALFLLIERPPSSETERPAGDGPLLVASRVIRWLVIIAALLVTIAYQAKRNTLSNFLLVFGPFIASIALLGFRELRRTIPPAELVRSARGIFSCAVGLAVPLLACIVLYAQLGLLSELYFNVWVIPRTLTWFQPFPELTLRAAGSLTAVLAPFLGIFLWQRRLSIFSRARVSPFEKGGSGGILVSDHSEKSPSIPLFQRGRSEWIDPLGENRQSQRMEGRGGAVRWMGRGVLVLLLLVSIILALQISRPSGFLALLGSGVWYGDVFRVIFFLPLLIVLRGMPMVFGRRAPEPSPSSSRALVNARGLFYFAAASSMLLLYPAADLPHVIMALPVFLPLLAYELAAFHAASESRPRAPWLSATVVVSFCALLASPFVHAMIRPLAEFPASSAKLKHATGIVGPPPHFEQVTALVARLEAMKSPGRGLLVLPGQQLLYFLSAWPSAAEREEFVFYAVVAGIITDQDAQSLVSQERVVERLVETNALVVDQFNSKGSKRFRKTFPVIASYLAQHYELEQEVGTYQLLGRSESKHRIDAGANADAS